MKKFFKHLKYKQKHQTQVTFIKEINLKNINKRISSNFHQDNMLKKTFIYTIHLEAKQVLSTYATLKKRCIKIVDT